ncbi:TKL protein kinase [Saprolegnia parasitica CBS 223.65]|uniref:TKL protein kinase n=1 Tax=Saprolegnia parasitica (strain CBS 223.65) TaxID=695850 RepID=A0A067C8R3_SAPPC|nr:TKL protein kinase [Saprolegnia parasitica CBS 223.65]KDO27149.1 TKL protein kinase [Saprolegnia parasitica CBS 223.65]|eukprot:XP_012202237.1 TKL protein kinase [Saprolegnia parasitica CBS 223.65]
MRMSFLRRRLDEGMSSATLNTILGVVAGVILLLIVGYFVWHRRTREARREARYYGAQPTQPPPAFRVRGEPAAEDGGDDDDQRTFNFHQQPPPPTNMPSSGYVLDSEDDFKRVATKKTASAPPFKMDQEMLAMKVDFHLIQYTRKLTKGAFGEVWLGQFKGRYVAIKQILEERKADKKEIECFVAEIKLMLHLQHPNVLDFLGFSWNPRDGNLCFLTEYMKNGDLFYHLQKRKATLTWPIEKIKIALDIAQGLVYLHSLTPKIIHRDLKSKNVLLDANWTAKINDFGISRVRQFEETMTAGVGTALWAAPEVFMGKKYNDRADIYSLGVVLSELDTCAIPFADQAIGKNGKLDGMAVIKLVTQKRAKPTFSVECPPAVLDLAMRCLDYEPERRPSAMEVVRLIQDVVQPALCASSS